MNMQQAQQKSWLGRNWKWLVPTGCLGLILIVVIFVVAIVMLVFGAMKSSDVYQEAVRRAKADDAVVRELGTPVEAGWMVSGSVNVENDGGEADLKIPVSGPNKSGTIYAEATRKGGAWQYSVLEVEVEGGAERIDLLKSADE